MPMYVSGGKSFLMNSLTISIACGRVTGSMLWKTMQTVFTSRSGRDAPAVCPGFAWLSASRRCSSRPGTIRKLRTCWRTPSSKISTSPGLGFFHLGPFLVAHEEVERHLGGGDPDRRSRRGGSCVLRPAGASANRNEAYKERNTNLLHRTILSLSAGGRRAAQERNHRWTRIHTDKTDCHTIAPMRADRQSFFNRVNLCASVVN